MHDLIALKTVLVAHWGTIMIALGVYIAIGTALGKKWPMPAATAPRWKRAAHFLLVNLPMAGRSLGGKTIWGLTFNIPLVSFALRPDAPLLTSIPAAPPEKRGDAGRIDIHTMGAIALGVFVFFVACACMTGCATSQTPAGATLAQKLHDDEAAIGQIELDVKTQCGADFAPLAVQAGAVLSIAEAAASASAGNIAGAVGMAAPAFPTLAGDAVGIACVVRVLEVDYQKYKPKTSAWLKRLHPSLEAAAARRLVLALIDTPPICDPTNDPDVKACRAITVDDEWPAASEIRRGEFCIVTEAKASARPSLIAR